MANLQDLPPELIAMIIVGLDLGSHMSLMLASKTLFSMIPEVRLTRRQDWIDFNLNFEQHVPRRRGVPILTCTVCAKLHPRAMFSDAQSKKTNPSRFCIETGLRLGKYFGSWRTFRVGGVVMFGCAGCYKAWPETEAASYGDHPQYDRRFCKACWNVIGAYGRWTERGSSAKFLLLAALDRALTYRSEVTAEQYAIFQRAIWKG